MSCPVPRLANPGTATDHLTPEKTEELRAEPKS